ncbi:MAG: cytochrome-c peroxidase, partial [Flavobacteriales bacterium]
PFFNPAEMNNPDTATLIRDFLNAPYYPLYSELFGEHQDNTTTYQNICKAIAAFERSSVFNEFSSKFDLWREGKVQLNDEEQKGLELFQGKGRCVNCHSMDPDPVSGKILFTNFNYYNLGIPRNELNPFYHTFAALNPEGTRATDFGLGSALRNPDYNGAFRVPSLRNVQYTKPYFHNGFASTIREAVHFMNARDLDTAWVPEVDHRIARQWTGSLHLTPAEEEYIVQFLFTLSDGYEEE